ncbi:hypothetical protein CYMTET_50857, partial [Cymbomonas tetramitiformis]
EGNLYSWGSGAVLGTGNLSAAVPAPVEVLGRSIEVKIISARGDNAGAIDGDGALYMWGENNSGTCGDGTLNTLLLPTRVGGVWEEREGESASKVALGQDRVIVATSHGRLKLLTWGGGSGTRAFALVVGEMKKTTIPSSLLSEDLGRMLDNEELSGSEEENIFFHVNSGILKARCEVLRTALRMQMKESSVQVLHIKEATPAVVHRH